MAKINHHNFIETVNDMLVEARKRGVIQLKYNSDSWDGNRILVEQSQMVNFGTCGYLGLEADPRIIEKSMEYTKQFGTQFSVSRAYLTSKSNFLLEELLSQIFQGNKVISFTSTSLAHSAVLPIMVGHNDLIILDQQCHVSIQTAAQLMAAKGVKIDMIRHNQIDMLEHKIRQERNNYDRIWYMIDGVYSMYGDVAPIDRINELMERYEQLNLYVDDAHGMSWHGKHGNGRIYDKCFENGRTLYVSTLAKGFGTMGGIIVFPNDEWYEKVILHGGPLAYSHPIPPPMMGASIASAEIHLTDEIYMLQRSLKSRMEYTNEELAQADVPVLSSEDTPIYFIGTGQPSVGYNLNKRILDEGFYVNIGMFPAVPVKNTGLRFTLTNHHSTEEIRSFVQAIAYHYPKALEEESKNMNDVLRAFRMPVRKEPLPVIKEEERTGPFAIQWYDHISEIDSREWDECFAGKGNFDWNCMSLLESSFQGNERTEENWSFHYCLVRDAENKVLLATFFTEGLFKDDLLSTAEVSAKVEEMRLKDPYFLCSRSLIMGSMFTEGDHLYINTNREGWKKAAEVFLDSLQLRQEEIGVNSIILRDFSEDQLDLAELFHEAGYFKMKMPNSNILFDLQRNPEKEYIELLSAKARRNIRYEVVKHMDQFEFEIKERLNDVEEKRFYELYKNVASGNRSLNIFQYPFRLFHQFSGAPGWEFLILRNKTTGEISGVLSAFKTDQAYFPVVIGLDYEANKLYSIYKQMLYRLTLYARNSGFEQIHFGITADQEKKKLGASQLTKNAFVMVKDQFNMEMLDKISV